MPGKWGGARRVRPPLDPPMAWAEIQTERENTLFVTIFSFADSRILGCRLNVSQIPCEGFEISISIRFSAHKHLLIYLKIYIIQHANNRI